jgi:DNA-binding transcriptional ArsR family regulator
MMKSSDALAALGALAHPTRLELFRRLIRAGRTGLGVGELRSAAELPGATLSNHLNVLRQARLVMDQREGRTIRCTADYARMDALVGYLLENCCAGEAAAPACAPSAGACAPVRLSNRRSKP